MATVTPMLDKRYASQDDAYPLVIRVHHAGKRKYVPMGCKLRDTQFVNGKITQHSSAKVLNSSLASRLSEIQKYLADCELHGKPVRLDFIGKDQHGYSFTDYLTHRSGQYKQKGQIVMSQKLKRFVKELTDCFGRNLYFEDITPDALRTLDAYLIKAGNCENTRHKKFKFYRQFFGQGFDEGKTDMRNPFNQYKIQTRPVKKDKLTREQIAAIENLHLNAGPVNDARNLFLFSYYSKGARFENCLTLHRTQIRSGRIAIQTNKGGKHISVEIHPRLQTILNQYNSKGLVFPFLTDIPEDPSLYLRAISSQNFIVNRNLKVVAQMAGIDINLSFHVARHSFAYHLKQVSNNVNIIQDALGHSDQRITQAYLKSLGDEILDIEMAKLYGT